MSDDISVVARNGGAESVVSADPSNWPESQRYELDFWRNQWPHRHLSVSEIQEVRHRDAMWLLGNMGFTKAGSDYAYQGFEGRVLEVGCGPMGFFEKLEGVSVVSQDSLMALYASNLDFSSLGQRGAVLYIDTPVADIVERFDFVVCSNVLDHTGDWISFLIDCVSRLEEGGELLLITDSRGVPAPGHTQIFNHDQLVNVLKLLGAQGFKVDSFTREDGEHCDFRHYLRAQF